MSPNRALDLPQPTGKPRPAVALRHALRTGYGLADLRADLLAGVVVGVVALPLSMALSIASGAPPQNGLYTAIVAGAVIAMLGGSSVQVSGPTAAFVVLLAPVSARFGLGGLMVASLLAGLILMLLGLARFGGLIEFVPYPVTTGFTAGIAVVIAILQLRDFFGLPSASGSGHVLDRLVESLGGLPSARGGDLLVGALTLFVLLAWPRFSRGPRLSRFHVPAPLVAIVVALLAAAAIARLVPDLTAVTIGDKFTYALGDGSGGVGRGIPRLPPLPAWPWDQPGPDGQPFELTFALVRDLLPAAFAIALLGAIESLLSATVADGMTGSRHDPDAELLAQGTGNVIAPFFGGFAATGAIARTATNVRAGARSPIAAVAHSAFVLAAVLLLAPLLADLPMAALAAILLLVAWNMAEPKHTLRLLRIAPRSDVFLLLACFALTVLFDMVVAVLAGTMLGALLFLRRMAEVSAAEAVEKHPERDVGLPPGVLLYRLGGPLFFAAAPKAMAAIQRWEKGARGVVLDFAAVPALDATGLIHLEAAAERLRRGGLLLVLSGLHGQPLRAALRAGFRRRPGVEIRSSLDDAIARAAAWDPHHAKPASP